MRLTCTSVNHRLPSGPAHMFAGDAGMLTLKAVMPALNSVMTWARAAGTAKKNRPDTRGLYLKKPFTSRMKSTLPGAVFCTLNEPDASSASCTSALFARVWPAVKEIE